MIPPVVDVSWLAAHPDALVADARWYLDGRSGHDAYLAGHIPGAVFVDLDSSLAGPPSPAAGRHPLPDPDRFAAAMGRSGIGERSTVVAYDDAGGTVAARLVWMLRSLGCDAALLDGGLAAWDGELERSPSVRPPARFATRPWPEAALADIDDVAGSAAVILDAREPARFRGEHEPVDPRAGHIPGALNMPSRANLDGTGRFLPVAELRARFEAVGAGAGTICYCGSGVTACHTLLALEHAGLGPGRLYPGSWSQYSSDPDRPAETGA